MIRCKLEDLIKVVELLKKESLSDFITIKEDLPVLKFTTTDRDHKDLILEISDTNYPRSPRVTRTESII